jgi:hypothetical protein
VKKSISLLTVSVISILAFLFYYGATQPTEAIRIVNNPPQNRDLRSEKFEPARKLLRDAGVPFDPDILLSRNWEKQLVPTLSGMTEMQTTLRPGAKLSGVQIADTIILPEKVELTGDLVVLANRIVFEGLSTQIFGIGKNVYFYPVKETFHLGKNFESAMKQKGIPSELIPAVNTRSYERFELDGQKPTGVVAIRVPGQGYDEWRKKYEVFIRRNPRWSNEINPEVVCTHLARVDCFGEPGAPGLREDDGFASGNTAAPPRPGVHGRCTPRQFQDGIAGLAGDNGLTGPENAGQGKKGNIGGRGGRYCIRNQTTL